MLRKWRAKSAAKQGVGSRMKLAGLPRVCCELCGWGLVGTGTGAKSEAKEVGAKAHFVHCSWSFSTVILDASADDGADSEL